MARDVRSFSATILWFLGTLCGHDIIKMVLEKTPQPSLFVSSVSVADLSSIQRRLYCFHELIPD